MRPGASRQWVSDARRSGRRFEILHHLRAWLAGRAGSIRLTPLHPET
jgi:hypothetical protein